MPRILALSLFFSVAIAAASSPEPARGQDASAAASAATHPPVDLGVDFGRIIGKIRPIHGVNGGPVNYGGTVDMSAHFRELGIPLARLHDCHWPNPNVVDIHAIFPDFRADPEQPESYRFGPTDDFVASILATGMKILFRLGESIEHTPRRLHVHPPADPQKWTAVCLGIIRHYNEGWAGGFRHDIRYWEIWNEPENRPAMWSGTDEDYYRLYCMASKAIKTRFPDVRVGGPAVGSSGEITGGVLRPTEFVAGFLGRCRAEKAPLDFFSWHLYSPDPDAFRVRAIAVRKLLDEQGFAKTESHLNEWNYLPDGDWSPMLLPVQGLRRQRMYERIGGAEGAAFLACALIGLENSPLDMGNYYSADIQGFGLYNWYGVPKKTHFAMKAIAALTKTPQAVATTGSRPGQLAIAAGMNEPAAEATVVISRFRGPEQPMRLRLENLPSGSRWTSEVFLLDGKHDLESVARQQVSGPTASIPLALPTPGVVLVRLRKDGQ